MVRAMSNKPLKSDSQGLGDAMTDVDLGSGFCKVTDTTNATKRPHEIS